MTPTYIEPKIEPNIELNIEPHIEPKPDFELNIEPYIKPNIEKKIDPPKKNLFDLPHAKKKSIKNMPVLELHTAPSLSRYAAFSID